MKVDGAHSNSKWLGQWNGVVVTNYEPANGGQGNGAGSATTAVHAP